MAIIAAAGDYPLIPPLGGQNNFRPEPQPQEKDKDSNFIACGWEADSSQDPSPRAVAPPPPVEQGEYSGQDQERGLPAYGPEGKLLAEKPGEEKDSALPSPGERAELDIAQAAEVAQLRARDQEVRAHEQAHISAGAGVVRGGARFEYTTGPDGKRYAVGGEVSIDCGKANTPEATLQKARTISKAALAPVSDSPQDRQVAAAAARMEQEARADIRQQRQEETRLAAESQAAEAEIDAYSFAILERKPGPPPLSVRLKPFSTMV